MNRFFDVGYHHGEGLSWFRKQYAIDKSWTVFCLEPNPACGPAFSTADNVINLPVAAWVYDGSVQLQQHEGGTGFRDGVASSITPDWMHPDMVSAVDVPCVDFAELLLYLTDPGDFVVVKLDIEGAEYAVCRRLLQTSAIARVRVLHVEFHQHFLALEDDRSTESLRQELARHTKVIDHW